MKLKGSPTSHIDGPSVRATLDTFLPANLKFLPLPNSRLAGLGKIFNANLDIFGKKTITDEIFL
jgi:hypothetical protein